MWGVTRRRCVDEREADVRHEGGVSPLVVCSQTGALFKQATAGRYIVSRLARHANQLLVPACTKKREGVSNVRCVSVCVCVCFCRVSYNGLPVLATLAP